MHRSRILDQSLPSSASRVIKGISGRLYRPVRALQPPRDSKKFVVQARSENRSFVLKRFPNDAFYDHAQWVNRLLAGCQNIRLVKDKIPKEKIFVYDYFTTDLLQLMIRAEQGEVKITKASARYILRLVAYGLKELHDHGFMHTDLKPNNVVVDHDVDDKGFVQVSKVKIADEDNIVFLHGKKDFNPKGGMRPLLVGNEFWRSPEQQVGFGIGQAADVWSFGVMCIHMIFRLVIFEIAREDCAPDVDLRLQVLDRMFKYFGPAPPAFFDHIGLDSLDKEEQEVLLRLNHFDEHNKLEPFWDWATTGDPSVDEETFSFLRRMLSLDPGGRATIDKVLDDPWWNNYGH